jgi:hypothetical protein
LISFLVAARVLVAVAFFSCVCASVFSSANIARGLITGAREAGVITCVCVCVCVCVGGRTGETKRV